MSDHKQDVAQEIAFEHADGRLTRREALRRLALLGLGLTAAGSLLAACERDEPSASAPTPMPHTTGCGALMTEAVTFPGPDGRTLQGAWAAAPTPRGAVLVIHENQGLTDHIRTVAGQLACGGFASLAVDLLSEEGGTAKFTDHAKAAAALRAAPAERLLADMRAGVAELGKRASGRKRGAVGFGDDRVWQLVAGEPALHAAVPFYGDLPPGADLTESKAAVLAIYADADGAVNASRDRAKQALTQAGLTHEILTLEGDHSFFNSTLPSYNPQSAQTAYVRVLEWLGTHLA